jgi:hypothetical protein
MADLKPATNVYERMLQIDRRWIFLLLAMLVVLVYLLDIKVPVYVTDEVTTSMSVSRRSRKAIILLASTTTRPHWPS